LSVENQKNMESNIVGRGKELAIIDKLLTSGKAEFLAVYGRRRVGKTFIVREHLKSQIQFSFSGSFEEVNSVQLANFFHEYVRRTRGKRETTVPHDWSMAFHYLADYLFAIKDNQAKVVVFIDELPWIDTPKSGFVKALEYFWNQHASTMSNLLLVVCGSAASWMQHKLLKDKGGLYNRITKRIKLEPFTLYETEQYCKIKRLKLTRYQIIQLYMVMGGVPFYWNELSQGKSAEQLIDEICFESTGLLATEYHQLYYSLFKNAENHVAVIEALAGHPYGLSRDDLLKKSGLPEGGTFNRTVEDLYESGFITKHRPFEKKKKETIYRLIDMYSLFYLNFINNNVKNRANTWQKIANQARFVSWSGYAFENICLQHSNQILNKLGISGTFTEISSWRHKGNDELPGAQIDMLIDRKDGMINLCEAKFSNKEFIIDKDYNAVLRQKRAVFSHVTKTKKSVVTTLITTYPAMRNSYYLEEIHSEVNMDDLFVE
jgi:AAA+ ATPase superfamily predicted ATPase